MAPGHEIKTSLRQRIDEFLRDDTTTNAAFSAAATDEAERLGQLLSSAEEDLRAAQARVAGLKRSLAKIDLPGR